MNLLLNYHNATSLYFDLSVVKIARDNKQEKKLLMFSYFSEQTDVWYENIR